MKASSQGKGPILGKENTYGLYYILGPRLSAYNYIAYDVTQLRLYGTHTNKMAPL